MGSLRLAIPIKVAGLETINLAFSKPIKLINKPIPAEIAKRSGLGIAFTIYVLTLKTDNIKKKTPAQKTAPKAT